MKRIEKRVPFGFKGEWVKLYVNYTYGVSSQNVVVYQMTSYADIGQDVQVKLAETGPDKRKFPYQTAENAVVKGVFRTVQTTDAYFCETTGTYVCIMDVGDIVFFRGEWWVVDSVTSENVYNPKPQTFYTVDLKKIEEEIVRG